MRGSQKCAFWLSIFIIFCAADSTHVSRPSESQITKNKDTKWFKFGRQSEFCFNQTFTLNVTNTIRVKENEHCLMTFSNYRIDSNTTHLMLNVSLTDWPAGAPDTTLTIATIHRYDLNKMILPLQMHENEGGKPRLLTKASRVICLQNSDQGDVDRQQDMDVVFHTDSPSFMTAEVILSAFELEDLKIDKTVVARITPSSPTYYKFSWKSANYDHSLGSLSRALVSVNSPSDSCMTLSIQRPDCPNYDRESNVKYEGVWQTVSRSGAINVDRNEKHFQDGFFVVLVLHRSSTQCYGKSMECRREETLCEMENPAPTADGDKIMIECCRNETQCHRNSTNCYKFEYMPQDIVKYVNLTLTISPKFTHPVTFWMGIFLPILFLGVLCLIPLAYVVIHWPPPCHGNRTLYERLLDRAFEKNVQPSTRVQNHCILGKIFYSDLSSSNENIPHDGQLDMANVLRNRQSSYTCFLFTMSIFFTLPVYQLLIQDYQNMMDTGNYDWCYYNFECAHPLLHLYDGNHVLSNLPYIFFGLTFFYISSQKIKIMNKIQQARNSGLVVHDNGVYRAMGFALLMEGLLSGAYHICPTENNFQFDTCYMYAISFLGIVKLIQLRHAVHPGSHTTFILLAAFSVISVIGVLADTHGNLIFRKIFYSLFLLIHFLAVFLCSFIMYFIGTKVRPNNQPTPPADVGSLLPGDGDGEGATVVLFRHLKLGRTIGKVLYKEMRLVCSNKNWRILIWSRMMKTVILSIFNGWLWFRCFIIIISEDEARRSDVGMEHFPSLLLDTLLGNFAILLVAYIICKFIDRGCNWRSFFFWQSLIYLTIFVAFFGTAYGIFFKNPLAQWEATAALSKTKNGPCYLFSVYDFHDMWHFLSAIALFSGLLFMLTLDDDLIGVPRNEIHIF